ncbi:MAG: peptidylprolyl isomerase [Bacteroidales bacterium]
MRHYPYFIIVALILFSSPSLWGQKYEKGLIDKTVVLIGNDMIQLSAIESEVQMMLLQGFPPDKDLRCNILEQMLIQKLLLTQARLDSLEISPDNVESELESRLADIMTRLGGEKEVTEYFKKPIYRLKEEWRETLSEQFLTQEMRSKVAQGAPQVTPSDVYKYFKRTPEDSLPIIPTQYRYRQIAFYPEKEEATLAVKERLLEFRERVIKGERFSTIATLYSEDPGTAIRGGELGMASKNLYWPQFSDAAISLKKGQVSQIVETPDGFHLIQMIEKSGDMFNARHILLKPKFTNADRDKAFHKLDSIKVLIEMDSISFADAAKRYSQDTKSYLNGGVVSNSRTGSLFFPKDELKVQDFNILNTLKEGEISYPFESADDEGRSGNLLYKIVKLEEIIPSHIADYKRDYNILQERVQTKLAMEEIDKFIKEKRETTFIRIDPIWQHCTFLKEGWIK